MIPHVDSICKIAFFHLHNIPKIRRFLTPRTKTVVHAFVTSTLGDCNSLLYGLARSLLQKLQRVLNCGAKLVCQSRKFDHATPIMIELRCTGYQLSNVFILKFYSLLLRLLMDLLQCSFLTFYHIIVLREFSDPLIKNCFKLRNTISSDMVGDHSLLQRHFYGMPYPIILRTLDLEKFLRHVRLIKLTLY